MRTLGAKVREGSQTRAREHSASRRTKIPKPELMARASGPTAQHRNSPSPLRYDIVPVLQTFGAVYIEDIMKAGRFGKAPGRVTELMVEAVTLGTLSDFLEDADYYTQRWRDLLRFEYAFELKMHQMTWKGDDVNSNVYRHWCAEKGWTFTHMEKVAYSWGGSCTTPLDEQPPPDYFLPTESVTHFRTARQHTLRIREAVGALIALHQHGAEYAGRYRERKLRQLEATFGQMTDPPRGVSVFLLDTPSSDLGVDSNQHGRCRRCMSLHHESKHCNVDATRPPTLKGFTHERCKLCNMLGHDRDTCFQCRSCFMWGHTRNMCAFWCEWDATSAHVRSKATRFNYATSAIACASSAKGH